MYNEEQLKSVTKLQNKTVCLSLDGWSNIKNQPIICACVTTDGNVFLVETIDTSGNPHTSEYLAELTIKIIKHTEEKYKCFVKSVVTDNTANRGENVANGQRNNIFNIWFGA